MIKTTELELPIAYTPFREASWGYANPWVINLPILMQIPPDTARILYLNQPQHPETVNRFPETYHDRELDGKGMVRRRRPKPDSPSLLCQFAPVGAA